MAFTNRGGPPFSRVLTVTTAGAISMAGVADSTQAAGAPHVLEAKTSWLRFYALTNPVRVYFTEDAFTANEAAYALVPVGVVVEFPGEVNKLWMRAEVGTATLHLLAVSKSG